MRGSSHTCEPAGKVDLFPPVECGNQSSKAVFHPDATLDLLSGSVPSYGGSRPEPIPMILRYQGMLMLTVAPRWLELVEPWLL